MYAKVAGFVFTFLILVAVGSQFIIVTQADSSPWASEPEPEALVYIKDDGSIVPSTAPIERAGNVYRLTEEIFNQTIIIEQNNIVLDGAGFKIEEKVKSGKSLTAIDQRGLYLNRVKNVTVQNMEVRNFNFGIFSEWATNCVITNITLTNDAKPRSEWIGDGFNLRNCLNCQIINNRIENCSLVFYKSSNGIISNNTLQSGTIELYLSYYNMFTENRIYDGNFKAQSRYLKPPIELKDYTNSIDTSNLVNDAPIYYLVNQTNLIIDSKTTTQIGTLVLANCDNITIKDATIMQGLPTVVFWSTTNSALINCTVIDRDGHTGVELTNSSNILISNNNITSYAGYVQHFGVYQLNSVNNTISDNFVGGTWWFGIVAGDYNIVSGNTITRASTGLHIGGKNILVFDNEVYSTTSQRSAGIIDDAGAGMQIGGRNNEVFRNVFRNNGLAIGCYGSNCLFYENDFANNSKTIGGYNDVRNNWDNGTVGNYWDVYQGEDLNADGIGDTPFIIDERNQDNYPLMEPAIIPEFSSWIVLPLFMGIGFMASVMRRERLCAKKR